MVDSPKGINDGRLPFSLVEHSLERWADVMTLHQSGPRKQPLAKVSMGQHERNEYLTPEYARAYLAMADSFPHRSEGETVLVEVVPKGTKRVLDLGTGDGRLLQLVLLAVPDAAGIGLDFSASMVAAAKERFSGNKRVKIVEHDFNQSLPNL